MLKQYISSLLLLPLLVGCSTSHTERIKSQLGSNLDDLRLVQAEIELADKDCK